jgi:hypothetical protein
MGPFENKVAGVYVVKANVYCGAAERSPIDLLFEIFLEVYALHSSVLPCIPHQRLFTRIFVVKIML